MAAFVLGNGRSRSPIDVNRLLELGPVYGCNALYRTHTPTVLIATDRPISEQIQKSGYPKHNRFYTRRPLPDSGAHSLLKPYHGFSSGPNAMALAAHDGNRKIYLLGFDMGPAESGKFNNVYSDTEFYKTSNCPATYTGNWIKQICTIAKDFKNVVFIRVHGSTTTDIPEFSTIPNLEKLVYADFVARINTPKDL